MALPVSGSHWQVTLYVVGAGGLGMTLLLQQYLKHILNPSLLCLNKMYQRSPVIIFASKIQLNSDEG